MKTHRLKCHPDPFNLVASGLKLHEVRVADRDFNSGDAVELVWYDPIAEFCNGREIRATIGHVTRPGEWGLPDNVCVFSLLNVKVCR